MRFQAANAMRCGGQGRPEALEPSPLAAWDEGYREALTLEGVARLAAVVLGRDRPLGLWRLFGARLAVWHLLTQSGKGAATETGRLKLWEGFVWPRFQTGKGHDAARLETEVRALGTRIAAASEIPMGEVDAETSALMVRSGLLAPAPSADQGRLRLGELAWVRIGPAPGRAAPHRVPEIANDGPALRDHVAASGAEWIVVVPDEVALNPDASRCSIDPDALDDGRTLATHARSLVTGLSIPHGPRICSLAAIRAHGGLPPADRTIPVCLGTYGGSASPWDAFRNGHRSVAGHAADTPDAAAGLALAASLGAEALNGPWWIIGACHGLLGGAPETAWSREAHLLDDPDALPARATTLTRMVRQRTNIAARAQDRAASRALKRILGPGEAG